MKRVIRAGVIPLVLCLVLVVTSCCGGGTAANEIKVGIVGPMDFIQGEHHWHGAQMAADEINAAGGIMVGGEAYQIRLVQVDTNEILSVTDATSAMERAITVDDVHFLAGGFRTEAVFPMQEIAMDYERIFMGCGSATKELCDGVGEDYDRYKYWFRITPINNIYLVTVDFMLIQTVADALRDECGIETPKVAILAEKLTWADPMVALAEVKLPSMGMELVGTWRPSDTATDVEAELTAIEDAGAQIIFTTFSGPVGISYARQWGELQIPAASVGINVEAQKQGFWDATGGNGEYEMTLNTYARVEISDLTIPFYDEFVDETGEIPTYNAGTYEALYILKEAIEAADSLDTDAVVAAMEDTDHMGTAGRIMFDEDHDVVWGAGYVTGLGVQWRDGEMECVWPPSDGSWEGVVYEGSVDYELPPWVIDAWAD
ncbi:MAG: ABC transporter substrate-binding protein [Chloroflexota bacterium]|nr:ABC transporter substrate-binding protein [Chloroflexota bacterium]